MVYTYYNEGETDIVIFAALYKPLGRFVSVFVSIPFRRRPRRCQYTGARCRRLKVSPVSYSTFFVSIIDKSIRVVGYYEK